MKITDMLRFAAERGEPVFSFEFFPPKNDAGVAALFGSLRALRPLGPSFVSVTWSAGGALLLALGALGEVAEIQHLQLHQAAGHRHHPENKDARQPIEPLLGAVLRSARHVARSWLRKNEMAAAKGRHLSRS